jgi:hypothetical protein
MGFWGAGGAPKPDVANGELRDEANGDVEEVGGGGCWNDAYEEDV